jgi:oxygen-independent coproporphyrinogen III oxidase
LAGIYIHIPFCKQACHYCDFHFSTNVSQVDRLVSCLNKEIEIQKDYLTESVETIYFGGGTPSLLNKDHIMSIMAKINAVYDVRPDAEITLEANPDDLSEVKLLELKAAGINRLSIGVQSFDDEVLKFLNRAHDHNQAYESIELTRKVGFDNVTVDLIYGIPDRSHDLWENDLKKLISLNPDHISAYCLTIEPKTAFGNWLKKGKLKAVEDDYSAQQFDIMVEMLENAGYEQYEVSNFCKPTYHSKHNTAYWQQKSYLGIGPSAHSYNLVSRQYNVSNNQKYINALEEGKVPNDTEVLTKEDNINDYLLTTLRTKWGTNLNELKLMGYSIDKRYIDKLILGENAKISDNHLILTRKGRLLADQISADLFIINKNGN